MTLTIQQIQTVGRDIARYRPLGATVLRFHRCLAFIKWLFGGNQSSKTYSNMMDLALLIMDCHPTRYVPNGIHWVCIERWAQARSILWEENLKEFIPVSMICDNGIEYGIHKTPKRIFFKNGHQLEFKSFKEGRGSFQGRHIDSIHCDEQCEHDFQGILDEMLMRLIQKNGYLSWSMTPILPQPALEERIMDLPDNEKVFKINLNSNRVSRGGYIPDKRIDDMIGKWPIETQAQRIAGDFGSYFGAVYKTYNRDIHMIKPFRIPKSWRRYRSFDFGYTNPFVCLWLAKDGDENWYVYREYYATQMLSEEHIRKVHLLSKCETYIENIADPENPEARQRLRDAGIRTKPARNAIELGVECVQSKFKVKPNGIPSLRFFNTCKNTLREHSTYHRAKGSKVKNPSDGPVAKDDHTCDAVRYALYTIDGKFKRGSFYVAT